MGSSEREVRPGPEIPENPESTTDRSIAEEDLQRAHIYGLLARLLAEPMTDETLETLRALDGNTDDTEFGRALASLGAMAVRTPRGAAEEEYSALFVGMGAGGELLPYASHYLSGFLYEKPLADLRGDLNELGIQPSGASKEPEDHAAFLCEVMHGLITGAFGEPADMTTQKKFFEKHIAPWVGLFFEDLEGAKTAAFYMPVGTIGKLFLAIEAEAFKTAA